MGLFLTLDEVLLVSVIFKVETLVPEISPDDLTLASVLSETEDFNARIPFPPKIPTSIFP